MPFLVYFSRGVSKFILKSRDSGLFFNPEILGLG